MKLPWIAPFLSVALFTACKESPSTHAGTVRVGTYHPPSLVLAWYRSPDHAKDLDALVTARDAALKAGDSVKVAECEKQGAALQDLAHRQLAGEAGIEDILARLAGDMPAIAKEASVIRIAAEGDVLGDRVEFVDVTDRLVERFHPDEATRKLLAEIREVPKGTGVH